MRRLRELPECRERSRVIEHLPACNGPVSSRVCNRSLVGHYRIYHKNVHNRGWNGRIDAGRERPHRGKMAYNVQKQKKSKIYSIRRRYKSHASWRKTDGPTTSDERRFQ